MKKNGRKENRCGSGVGGRRTPTKIYATNGGWTLETLEVKAKVAPPHEPANKNTFKERAIAQDILLILNLSVPTGTHPAIFLSTAFHFHPPSFFLLFFIFFTKRRPKKEYSQGQQ